MSRNLEPARAFFVFPLIVTILFWQSGSCRNNQDRTVSSKTEAAETERSKRVLKGMWGGEHVSVEVTANGAFINFDCAHGAIDKSFVTDRNGKFDVKGTYEIERPGPQRAGQESNSRPARYTGSIKGTEMTLTIILTDKNETVGTFTLTHGAFPQIVKCL